MLRPAPLILAYDGECPMCRGAMDWVQRRDRWGLIAPFPLQNGELLRIAPELAGRPLDQALHGVDSRDRRVFSGAALFPELARRLPRWRFVAPLMGLPGVAPLAGRLYRWVAARRFRCAGRSPLR